MRNFFDKHRLAILVAIIIGLIYGLPQIFFIVSLGNTYHGIPMIQTPNEDSYLARIQDILDGHPALGSAFFYEYKDQWPISPPLGEMFYALPAFLLHVSAANILTASKFILPAVLFGLIYFLIYSLTAAGEEIRRKLSAVAGALFVILGYDLVDYRHVGLLLSGQVDIGGFLLWARPVNPILGAIFLFSFLIFIWRIIQRTERLRMNIFAAAIFLALMIASYFFSWGMALSISAILIVIYFFKKEYQVVKHLIYTLFLAIIFSAPYWYSSWQVSKSVWYQSSVLHSGLFYTRYPLLNKLMLATAILYLIAVLFAIFRNSDPALALKVRITGFLSDWHWFCLAFILGSLWAYSQQIITGQTVWPYHFVQYSIPLAIVVAMVVLHNIVKKESVWFWRVAVFVVMTASLSYGLYIQTGAYSKAFAYHEHRQSYATLFDFLNGMGKDCVVFVREDGPESYDLNVLIPAFTHCNRYSSTEIFSLMPDERPYDNYLATLRLKGVSSAGIEEYLRLNKGEATGYLFSNWQGLFGVDDFPDFRDSKLQERLDRFPEDYRRFVAGDFRQALVKYRLDYILSVGALPQDISWQLGDPELVFEDGDIFLYDMRH